MKLALVTETFPPEVNGVSMTLGMLVRGLGQRGVKVQVVRPLQENEEKRRRKESPHCQEYLLPGVPLPGYNGLRMGSPEAYRLLLEWTEFRPDVVHIATEGPLGVTALWIASALNIPVTSTFHTNFHQYTGYYQIGVIKNLILVFLRVIHNYCRCTLAPTLQMANELASLGFKNTGVLSRGVDTRLFAPTRRDEGLRSEWGVSPSQRVFLYVGRVASEKNIDLAVEAFRKARSLLTDSIMVVVGDGPRRPSLEEKYPELVFAGMRKGEDLARHYASSDYFLFPSITETFGNVVTEALSSGLIVVTYDYAAGRALIQDRKNGFLAPFDSSPLFIEKTVAIAGFSDSVQTQMREAARRKAQGVSWDRVVDDFRQSLERVKRGDEALFSKRV